jgi:hypothetical protein
VSNFLSLPTYNPRVKGQCDSIRLMDSIYKQGCRGVWIQFILNMELLPLPCTVCIYSWPTVFWCVAIHIIFLFSLTGVSPTKWMESLNLSFDSFFFFRLFSNVIEWSSEWMHSFVHGRWPRLLISDHSELYSPSATSTSNNHRKVTIFQHGWPAYCALW